MTPLRLPNETDRRWASVRASTASVFTRAAAIAFVCRGWAS
jgi:hypothetical protein